MSDEPEGNVRQAVAIAPGVAVGPIFFMRSNMDDVPRRTLSGDQREAEIRRFGAALRDAEQEFTRQRAELSNALGESEQRIFDAHLEFYQDDLLRSGIERRIRDQQINAEAIITRCRMPPLNSCGYCLIRTSGSGIPTRSSSSTPFNFACSSVIPSCNVIASVS